MSNNSNKGTARFASVLQKRMSQVAGRAAGISVETGEILSGRKLKLSSLPGTILDKDDYSVCASLQTKMPCQNGYPFGPGDQVLVVWTYDGEPVVIDKILRADSLGALTSCKWQNTCPGLKTVQDSINDVKQDMNSLENRVKGLEEDG